MLWRAKGIKLPGVWRTRRTWRQEIREGLRQGRHWIAKDMHYSLMPWFHQRWLEAAVQFWYSRLFCQSPWKSNLQVPLKIILGLQPSITDAWHTVWIHRGMPPGWTMGAEELGPPPPGPQWLVQLRENMKEFFHQSRYSYFIWVRQVPSTDSRRLTTDCRKMFTDKLLYQGLFSRMGLAAKSHPV